MLRLLALMLLLSAPAFTFDCHVKVENASASYGTPITVAIEFKGEVQLFAFAEAVREFYASGDIVCEKVEFLTPTTVAFSINALSAGRYPFAPPPALEQTASGEMQWHFVPPVWLEWQPVPLSSIPLAPLFDIGGENLIGLTAENRLRLVESPEVIAREGERSAHAVEMRARVVSRLMGGVLLAFAIAFVIWFLADAGIFKLPIRATHEEIPLDVAFKKLNLGEKPLSSENLSQLMVLLRRSLGVIMGKNIQGYTAKELQALVGEATSFTPEEKELFVQLFSLGEMALFAREPLSGEAWQQIYPRLKAWASAHSAIRIR